MDGECLRSQIGQMIVVRASGHLLDHQIPYPQWEATAAQLHRWITDWQIGGVILLGGTVTEVAVRTEQLQAWAATPLLIAADIEEGVGQRFPGATWFPPPMALSAIADPAQADRLATQMGAITAQEALSIGVNWILAPVVDVNNNPNNPVINVRAFGEDPATVGRLAAAFIQGCHQYPVLTSAKHFPGHGDTQTDSHLHLPSLTHDRDRLQQVELPPFQAAIAAGVDSVMSGHLLIPAWDDQAPATLSAPILTGQLRHNLGFDGLIVTDALVMGGVANWASPEEVAVQAVAAGADIILMPADPEAAILAIAAAVEQGRIPAAQIAATADRIAAAKAKLAPPATGMISDRLTTLASPHAQTTVHTILHHSLHTHALDAYQAPDPAAQPINFVVAHSLLTCDFLSRTAPAIALPQRQGYQLRCLEPEQLLEFPWDTLHTPSLLQLFIRGNPFRGTASLPPAIQTQLKGLLRDQKIGAAILYGSPYLAQWLMQDCPPQFPWAFTYGQMPSAQHMVLETVFQAQHQTRSMIQGIGDEFI
ncbi:glycoside hydrolase family 3 N-terminal domain-containing protein [Spirulina major CS-329]|uniref:glycoside hydrolase family 3 N-terminal domain-containing protein n=1 Tax=Spirulina TaxID=1154 RepID=UPI00232E42BD|nr:MULTISPECIES: glycoside hydrolase family 3 N-terminal domain-containing protein [Spirulina]MDB9496786.1 glycoside hydrolase family 3 N-terminal domain-containing protein [Spirulina subsalsa CS-330]MDB9502401.1 glycoside hydrolase family 3 N-terminal domain-containing protein [Spirulina major CS-329]